VITIARILKGELYPPTVAMVRHQRQALEGEPSVAMKGLKGELYPPIVAMVRHQRQALEGEPSVAMKGLDGLPIVAIVRQQ
jgi:hypothetical protein